MDCVLSIVDEGARLRAAVSDVRGRVLGAAALPGTTNSRFAGASEVRRRLERLIGEASGSVADAMCLAVCAAVDGDEQQLRGLLAQVIPVDPARVLLSPLERLAGAGAVGSHRPEKLVVVRADISSRAWGVAAPERQVFKGGYGEILGDEGSAYWIGREAARAAVKCAEKRHRQTCLEKLMARHFDVSSVAELLRPDHVTPRLDRYAIASFAPRVFEAVLEGDATAQEILEQAGRELAVVAISVVSALPLIDESFSLLPFGSVFRLRGPTLETFMKDVRNKTMRVNFLREGSGALGGGLLMALDHLGLKITETTAAAIRDGLAE